MQLSDVKALVTGGSTGIGYEIASALIARGAQVAISGRDEGRLRQAAEAWLAANPQQPEFDVRFDVAAERTGKLQVVANAF